MPTHPSPDRRHCARVARHARPGAGVAVEADQVGGAVRARRHDRHPRAHRRRKARDCARPAGHHREQAGAGGGVGAEFTAKSAPDGYTIMGGTISTHAINASLYKDLPYDPVKDFVAITLIARVPNMLVVNTAVPAKDVKELIALLKANPASTRSRRAATARRSICRASSSSRCPAPRCSTSRTRAARRRCRT